MALVLRPRLGMVVVVVVVVVVFRLSLPGNRRAHLCCSQNHHNPLFFFILSQSPLFYFSIFYVVPYLRPTRQPRDHRTPCFATPRTPVQKLAAS
jgi:hypothetical protein